MFRPERIFQQYCEKLAGSQAAIGVMNLKTNTLIATANEDLLFQKRFPPGSVFKIVTALAVLEAGIIIPKESLYCSWNINLYNRRLDCSVKKGHGWMDLSRALAYSCNNFFE